MATRESLDRADSRDSYDFKRKLTVIGNSTGIIIPAEVLDEVGAMVGDEIGLEYIEEEGRIEVEFPVRPS